MIEKRFHSDLYDGKAVDAAVRVYESFGSFELEKEQDTFVVRISANAGVDEERLANEFANYALGTTIEARKAKGGPS